MLLTVVPLVRFSLVFGLTGTDGIPAADGAIFGIDPILTPGIILTTRINSLANMVTKPIASLKNVIKPEIIPATTPIAYPKLSAPL